MTLEIDRHDLTNRVITILDMRQPYAHGIPLAERLEDRAVWPAEHDGAPRIERARSLPRRYLQQR
jgi:hypothetical protein